MKGGSGTLYSCPMHPEIVRSVPGMCPECGMALVKVQSSKFKVQSSGTHSSHTEFNKHEGHALADFKRKFWVSLLLTIPVVLYSELPERIFGRRAPEFTGSAWLPLLLSSVVFFYGGWIFLASSYRELKARLPGMMTLIAIAITAAYAYSVFSTLSGIGNTLFWELTTLITVMLLGHYIEMRSVQSAQGALKELSKLLPDTAEKIVTSDKGQGTGYQTYIVPVSELKLGDLILVRPGGKIPADGVVVEGTSEVNESMITGESKPVSKMKEQEVIAGTVNGSGSLTVKVTKIGEQTFLSGVMRLVAEAQASKSRLQLLSDKAAFYLTVVAVGTGGVTLFWWIVSGAGISVAVERFVAVLVIACPHALGLAVPLVASISTTLAARSGLLVKRRSALEAARNIDVVLFDKTGTLTTGNYGVEKIIQRSTFNAQRSEVLRLAASIDTHSEHVVAKAIVEKARAEKLPLSPIKDFQAIPGKGARAMIGGKEVFVGGHSVLSHVNTTVPQELSKEIEKESKRGKTIVYVIQNNTVLGALVLADLIREESWQAIRELKKLGMRIAMITGDSEDVATWVSKELEIDEYFARVLPQQKTEIVKRLQAGKTLNTQRSTFNVRPLRVAMVGDGINDAPALTQADLGIAIGAGTNVAIESAGIILVRNDPRDIAKIIRLSRLTYRKMIENLFWATGYNVLAIPLAAGVLASYGIILQPAFSAFLMSLSTVIVSMNALLLRRAKLV